MTCAQCEAEGKKHRTLYDKTVSRRVSTASRRTKRTTASVLALGLLSLGSASALPAAQAASFGGFSTHADATPLRIEVHEPAIPIPSDPELELNFSYTKVDGTSGPVGTARASAMWPGDAIGEGLKTFGEQLGLPGALTDGGYPVQVNAQSPGDVAAAKQEFLPGMTGRVTATPLASTAKVGYGSTGDVSDGDLPGSTAPTNPLTSITKGDLGGLFNTLLGSTTSPTGDVGGSSPLGALSVLIGASGMESSSHTEYDGDTVVATATSRLGQVLLLGGIVKLQGVEVVTKTTSNLTDGAKVTKKVSIGGMSIAGQSFAFTDNGIEATGKATPIPGLPDAPAAALAALGITITLPKAVVSTQGAVGSVAAEALRITLKTKPLLSKLPKLPLDQLVSKLPDLPGQASILKGLIIALGQATPEVDLVLGVSHTSATTVEGIPGGVVPPTTPPVTSPPGTTPPGSSGNPIASSPNALPGAPQVAPTTPVVTTPTNPQAAISGLPPLGGLKTWIALLGFLIAAGAGWYLRRAGLLLFGGATTCTHGLKAGIPDLRKV
ncbi:MAG: hypothetical protein JWP74_2054 [Marmoricola sp.]|nr:hypothetical protein [Marmoricola sp.]